MIVSQHIADIRRERWHDPSLTWGLIPTMGYLHEGHLSLARQALRDNDRVGVSIFVNPLQFNNADDLARYPHDIEHDLSLLKKEGIHLVWDPTVETVYPKNFQTSVMLQHVTGPLEGAARPGHFEGVATVVAKLINVFQPNRTYFGQKDAQQVVVVKRMVDDLNFNTEIVTCPIVREADGLAMSSRNVNLTSEGRKIAPIVFQSLSLAKQAYKAGERSGEALRQTMKTKLNSEPRITIDYISVADPQTLEELNVIQERALLSMAVFLDKVRLIDNILLDG